MNREPLQTLTFDIVIVAAVMKNLRTTMVRQFRFCTIPPDENPREFAIHFRPQLPDRITLQI